MDFVARESDKEILHQMLVLRDRTQEALRRLGDIADNPKVDGRLQLKALKKRYLLAIELFKLNMEIVYTSEKLASSYERNCKRKLTTRDRNQEVENTLV